MNGDVHVATIRVGRIEADYADMGLGRGWNDHLLRNPDWHPDAAIRRRIETVTRPHRATATVSDNRSEWPAHVEHAAALASSPSARAVRALMRDGRVVVEASRVMEMVDEANADHEVPLFAISRLPAWMATHVGIRIPDRAAEVHQALANGRQLSLWPGMTVTMRQEATTHVVIPGAPQRVASIIADRLTAIATLLGVNMATGAACGTWSRTALIARRWMDDFSRRHGARMTMTEIVDVDGNGHDITMVARDHVAYMRTVSGVSDIPTRDDIDQAMMAGPAGMGDAAYAAALVDRSVMPEGRRAPGW